MMNLRALRLELPAPHRRLAGGERLMLALIGTLVDDLRGRNARLKTEVQSYVTREGASGIFGFASICSHFGWSERHVRRQLAKLGARPGERRRWRSYAA
jgi:hypothetical protein